MKHTTRHLLGQRAYTLIELMICTAIIGVTGPILYYILNTGMVLFAKNTAINIAHQEARVAVLQMEQDLHSAISIPQLTDATKTPIAGNGPAAGITFQLFAAGPFQITPSTTGYPTGQSQVSVRVNGYLPSVGQRLIIPTHQIELDISAVGAGSTDRSLTLASNLPVAVYTKLGVPVQDVNVVCFITDRVTYVVNGSQLLYYGRKNNNTYKVMANDLTAAIPFSIPVTPLGAPYNRFVAAINLSTADTSTSNRHFKAANMFLNAMEPYRARLCIYQ
ncbi:MAG: prepilin-type N-terminal cleavage/methylation domain-containing protein [Chthoniobacter sp.]|uniref:PulJ/GspJ family protein n=1 Tax=Chthoniobacter sp. TaxID=2510640 RepID=UPI0032A403FB